MSASRSAYRARSVVVFSYVEASRARASATDLTGKLIVVIDHDPAGKPLQESIAQYGPFVMNTREEIEQAVRDYQNNRLTD